MGADSAHATRGVQAGVCPAESRSGLGVVFLAKGFLGTVLGSLRTGAVDVATEPTLNLWDMAALDVIVREAGGTFTNIEGKSGPHGASAISSNSLLHQEFIQALN